jgi:hypothetical protein
MPRRPESSAPERLAGARRPAPLRVDAYEFGRITIDGVTYDHDVVVEQGTVRKRRKGPSKPRKAEFGHTPLTADEEIPWKARRLWVGTGAYGSLPVASDLREEARRRGVDLLEKPTPEIVRLINRGLPAETNVILHLTC